MSIENDLEEPENAQPPAMATGEAPPAPPPASVTGTLRARIAELEETIKDITNHATPNGLADENDPEGNPHHYMVTVGAIHRALGRLQGSYVCEHAALLRKAVAAHDYDLDPRSNGMCGEDCWVWDARTLLDFQPLNLGGNDEAR